MIIRRESINAALAVTTADDTRYFLTAIQIDPAKGCIVATNGHVLLVATEPNRQPDCDYPTILGAEYHDDPASPVLIDAETCKALVSAMPKKPTIAILASAQLSTNGSPTTITVAATDLKAPRVATIDTAADGRTFPAYERVMPAADRQGVKVCLAIDVLESLIKAAKAARGSSIGHITFSVPTGAKDIQDGAVTSALGVSVIGSDVTLSGAAMPCRM